MAVVENKASEIGDVVVIKTRVPLVGLVTLSSFTDSIINESGVKFFTREFRYSTDGVTYSTWSPLTDSNLAAISINPTSIFLAEYRYIRSGTDTSLPELEFREVVLNGTFENIPCGDAFSKSIFSQFFSCTDACVLGWMINVLEKMYEEGVIPKYIERGKQNNEDGQDQHFLEFWRTVSQYFAYIVCYARKWEIAAATGDREILLQYLQAQTFFFCGGEDRDDLTYIMNNTYDETRHRGTLEIIKTKDDGRTVNGEWHRLFCHLGKCTDWYFSSVFNYKIGWVGDSASPLYQGNYMDSNLVKGYEATEEVLSLAEYPLIEPSFISLSTETVNDGTSLSVMNIEGVTAGLASGIGIIGNGDTRDLIKISTKCDYEVTFWVKLEGSTNLLTFGVNSYDKNGVLSPNAVEGVFSGVVDNLFVEKVNTARDDRFYFVRGIIYNRDYRVGEGQTVNDYLLDISGSNSDTHLRFSGKDVCYIEPIITLDNVGGAGASGMMNLYDVKIRPLSTYYSTGFEQGSNFIKMGVENFNLNHSNKEAEEIIREFLIPYKNTFKISFLNPCESVNTNRVLDVLLDSSSKISSPSTSGVLVGDRYLIWDSIAKGLELKEYDGSSYLPVDNIQGNKVYVVGKKNTYYYNNSKWSFSCN